MGMGKVGLAITPWATHDEGEVVKGDPAMTRDIEAGMCMVGQGDKDYQVLMKLSTLC